MCRAWFAEDGVIDAPKIAEKKDSYFGKYPAKLITIGANYQHWNDANGVIYYDDIVASSKRVGPMSLPDAPGQNEKVAPK